MSLSLENLSGFSYGLHAYGALPESGPGTPSAEHQMHTWDHQHVAPRTQANAARLYPFPLLPHPHQSSNALGLYLVQPLSTVAFLLKVEVQQRLFVGKQFSAEFNEYK